MRSMTEEWMNWLFTLSPRFASSLPLKGKLLIRLSFSQFFLDKSSLMLYPNAAK